jgi:formylglycine-generating enzyme required for sulfatase activity
VVRGGACEFGPESLRAAARSGRRPDDPSGTIGFRVVRELTPEERKFHELSKRNHE